jgi:hypothetical protein
MSPRDRIALAIAVGLISWGIIMIAGIAWRNRAMSEGGGEIFLAIATGLCTALGAYFASGRNGNKQ